MENFLDMAHFPYVHSGYLGIEPHTEVRDYDVDITRSFAIGDAVRDLQAAEAAGLRSIWVRTGRTREDDLESAEPAVHPVGRMDDISAAARWILRFGDPGKRREAHEDIHCQKGPQCARKAWE